MDIDLLKSFITVAERSSFTDASRLLYISQPRLSLQIANLEKQLDIKLFHRNTHTVNLTPAGKVFYEGAKEIVTKYEAVIRKTRQTEDGLVGRLEIIYYADSLSVFLLPYLLKKFREVYPDIGIIPHQIKDEYFFQYLISKRADIGIGVNSYFENETGLEKQLMYKDRFCVVVPSDHRMAYEKSVSVSSLVDEDFVIYSQEASSSYLPTIQRLCANSDFLPKVKKGVIGTDVMLTSVEVGEGIALLPEITSKVYQSPHLCYIGIEEEEAGLDFVFLWKKDHQNPLISLFLDEIGAFQVESLIS